jgi:hypothetical protein
MATFAEQVQEWRTFYSTLASVCATLVGLLFVALSLSPTVVGREEDSELMGIARNTFSHFVVLMMTALVFLVPRVSAAGVALALLTLGATWLAGTGRRLLALRGGRQREAGAGPFVRSFGLSLAAGLGLVLVGVALLFGVTAALYLLMPVLAMLLAAASSTAWFLLARLRARP